MKNNIEISKFLSYVLRHKPGAIGLKLDDEGWSNISDLVRGAQQVGQTLNEEITRAVVENSEKQRFTMSGDGKGFALRKVIRPAPLRSTISGSCRPLFFTMARPCVLKPRSCRKA